MSAMMLRTTLVATMIGLAGCTTVGPDFQRPTAGLPDRWTSDIGQASNDRHAVSVDVRWWKVFNDPELSSLVERVAAANLDVKVASTRWMQARAARRMTGADAEPAIVGSTSYHYARASQNGLVDISGRNGKRDYHVWQPGLDASWELDLWGRVRREIESSDAGVEASADLRRGVLLAVLADTARDYLQLRGVQAQQAVVRQNLELARHTLRLTQIRLTDGVATRLDTAEASAQVSTIETILPGLESDRLRLVNALSYLLGAPPQALAHELQAFAPIPTTPASVPLGLPSTLAERRPDIRAAEARLHTATADIGVAVGDFYPRITLSGDVGLQAMQFGKLDEWGSRMFGIGPAISVPIFEGGRLKGQLALRKAQQHEAMVNFQRTVLAAWHEVDDALIDYRTREERHAKRIVTVEQLRVALENANRQYVAGETDFLRVITVEKDLLAAQQALLISATDMSLSVVGLYKALGGGWETTFPVAVAAPQSTDPVARSAID